MQNETQYDWDRKAAKISALSSNNLDRYEYLTGEDLSLKPSSIEQAKFECSPLGKIFNKGFEKDKEKEENKKVGLKETFKEKFWRKYLKWQCFIRCCKTRTKKNGKYAWKFYWL